MWNSKVLCLSDCSVVFRFVMSLQVEPPLGVCRGDGSVSWNYPSGEESREDPGTYSPAGDNAVLSLHKSWVPSASPGKPLYLCNAYVSLPFQFLHANLPMPISLPSWVWMVPTGQQHPPQLTAALCVSEGRQEGWEAVDQDQVFERRPEQSRNSVCSPGTVRAGSCPARSLLCWSDLEDGMLSLKQHLSGFS